MGAPLDTDRLPAGLREEVVRALTNGEGHEVAITEIDRYLADGGERTPEILVALARLTYEDAACLVLSELGRASRRAVKLLDEAIEHEAIEDVAALIATRRVYAATLEREVDRERRLQLNLVEPSRARPVELIELAHRILMSGDDDRAAATLMREAALAVEAAEEAEGLEEEAQPSSA